MYYPYEMRNSYEILVGNSKRVCLENLGVDGIMLKWIKR
jgi:hypothetical protein